MIKQKVNFNSVEVNTALNEEGKIYSMLFVNLTGGDNPYRVNEFLKFAEKQLLNIKHGINIEELKTENVSKYIASVSVVKDKSRYGEKKYLEVIFTCSMSKKISLEDGDYQYISQCFTENVSPVVAKTSSVPTQK